MYAIYTRRITKTYYVMIYYRSFLTIKRAFVDISSKCVWSVVAVQIKSYLDPDYDKSMENFWDLISFAIVTVT